MIKTFNSLFVTMFGIGGIFGQLLGGWAGQKLYNLKSVTKIMHLLTQ